MGDALLAGIVALLVATGTSIASFYVQREKLRQELRTEFMAEQAIVALLEHPQWTLRSFEAIRARVGGFEDQALQQLLVRAGALRFDGDGKELWGLRRRNLERLSQG